MVVLLLLALLLPLTITAPADAIDSIAVLPFENQTNDADMEYLSDGIANSIISSLSQISSLKVMSSSSVRRYKGTNPDPQVVAEELGVGAVLLAAIIHKFGVSVDFLRKFRAESVFRCDYKASKLVEPNRDEARAPSGNSSARRGLYICVGAGSQGTVRWDTDGASVMRRAFVRDKTMPGAPRCDEKFPEPGHRF